MTNGKESNNNCKSIWIVNLRYLLFFIILTFDRYLPCMWWEVTMKRERKGENVSCIMVHPFFFWWASENIGG